MPEKVRLIVWDLDETFWHGTLTEGGITIREDTCALVKDLAARGIMSSICSKNNFDDVKAVLEREGLWEYFIFPNISWEPKGPRIAAMVEMVQLRAPTIMFIDDNPLNLEEVRYFVPDIQVRSHEFIPEIAASPLFVGKDDRDLSRLQQYKLMETRKQDEQQAGGDNTDFLRSSNIRVFIEYDIEANIGRAIELINRTNQLNYTKRRLPEDPIEAKRILLELLGKFETQAGLVRVLDRYGDYGFVGFYLAATGRKEVDEGASWQTLLYYCFSCRTLGMFVEKWLYEHLRRPHLTVVGEVLTDLSTPLSVDWVQEVTSLLDGGTPARQIASEIRVHGGCEANALAHYLASHTETMRVTGNFSTGDLFIRLNAAALLLSACTRQDATFAMEATRLNLPYSAMAFDYFDNTPDNTLFVFSGGLDDSPGDYRYRHKRHGWEIRVEPNGLPQINCVTRPFQEVISDIRQSKSIGSPDSVIDMLVLIRNDYDSVDRGNDDVLLSKMRLVFDLMPDGSKMIIVLGSESTSAPDGSVKLLPWVQRYNRLMRSLSDHLPFATTVCFGDHIQHQSENHGNGHYGRRVYSRMSTAIVDAASQLSVKQKNVTADGKSQGHTHLQSVGETRHA